VPFTAWDQVGNWITRLLGKLLLTSAFALSYWYVGNVVNRNSC